MKLYWKSVLWSTPMGWVSGRRMANRKAVTATLTLLTALGILALHYVLKQHYYKSKGGDELYDPTRLRHNNTGRPMPLPSHMENSLRRLALKSIKDASANSFNSTIFVTGIGRSNFEEAKDTIAAIQHYFPLKKILVYDLGLNEEERNQVSEWCGVKYNKFHFFKYPDHISVLNTGAWKPAIIQEALHFATTVIFFDTTISIYCPELLSDLTALVNTSGVALIGSEGHSIKAATASGMFDYLKSDIHGLSQTKMLTPSLLSLTNTEDVYRNVLSWWLRCSGTKDCIAPAGSIRGCSLEAWDASKQSNFCHRFEESALNLILLQYFGGDVAKYRIKSVCVDYERDSVSAHTLHICKVIPAKIK